MSWDGLQGEGVRVAPSPLESDRFGLVMGRVTVGWGVRPGGPVAVDLAARELTAAVRDSLADVIVVRYPAQSLALAAALTLTGRDLIPAGSLTYWAVPVAELRRPDPAPGLSVISLADLHGSVDTMCLVGELVDDSFSGYGNHYAANPLLDPGAALAGYREWARSSALEDAKDALLLVEDGGKAIGLATLTDSEDPGDHVEVLLAGLRTAVQGQGLYATLLAGVAEEAERRGAGRLVISTQSHNIRVQRAWARLGLRPFAAIETVHVVRRGLLS